MTSYIVIPTYNEKENIARIVHAIFALDIPNMNILVVDDNSPDHTSEEVRHLQKQYDQTLHLITREGKLGLGSAYIAGFTYALDHQAEYIFEMDADGSHDPQDIPRLLAQAKQADVVIGSRRIAGGAIQGWNIFRHLSSWGAMTLARIVLRLKTHDVTAGFRCYRRHVLENISINTITSNGYAFQEEMIWRCEKKGFTVVEIPITFKNREYGKSKLSHKEIIEFFMMLIRLMFTRSHD